MHHLPRTKIKARILTLFFICLPVLSQAALDAELLEGLSARSLGPAAVYIEQARATLDDAREALNRFMNEDVAAFGNAVDDAGIGLFAPTPPLQAGNKKTGS